MAIQYVSEDARHRVGAAPGDLDGEVIGALLLGDLDEEQGYLGQGIEVEQTHHEPRRVGDPRGVVVHAGRSPGVGDRAAEARAGGYGTDEPVGPVARGMVKVLTEEQAALLVRDGDVVAVSGCVSNMVPERLCAALEQRHLETGHPVDLTEYHLHIYGLGLDAGLEHFAHAEMTRRVIGGSFAPPYWFKGSRMAKLVADDEIEAFVIPAGVIAAMFAQTGAGRPGVLTRIGWGTFVDPRNGGGRINERARASGHRTCDLVRLGDEEWLFYFAQPIDVSFVRGTVADEDGNVSFEDEPMYQAVVSQAMATKASGGTVVAQVRHLVERGSLDPRLVRLPSILVDAVVVVPEQRQFEYGVHGDSPALSGSARLVTPAVDDPGFSASRIVARRAALEMVPGQIANLGAGIPVFELPAIIHSWRLEHYIDFTIEHGSLGGTNLGGMVTATHWNPSAIIDSNLIFDFYAGGGLDIAFLGAAQVDGAGNVNVTKFGDTVVGVGGFMDIAQSARKVVFCTTLRHGGLEVEIVDGALRVVQEGRNPKFVGIVELVSFAADWARRTGQEVIYVTERCVFRLAEHGLLLIEVAPGVDVARDVRPAVGCDFEVNRELTTMPEIVFSDEDLVHPVRGREVDK